MNTTILLLLLLLAIFAPPIVVSQQLFIGDSCLTNYGTSGVCRILSRCPVVQQSLQTDRNNHPVICSYQGRNPIVCCPRGQQTTLRTTTSTTTVRTTTSTTTVTPTTQPEVQHTTPRRGGAGLPFSATIDSSSLSEQKCHEYAQYVYERIVAPTLADEIVYINRSTCAAVATPLVVGGEPVQLNEYPHMALLGYGLESQPVWLCGGFLISENFVLTAAHCLSSRDEGDVLVVRLGELEISNPNDGSQPQTINVAQRIAHPDYRPPARYNDIALLRLAESARFTASVRPACLHRLKEIPNGGEDIQLIATGWGRIGYTENTSDYLLKVLLRPIEHAQCNRTYRNEATTSKLRRGIDDDSMLCAGEPEGGKDTCQGDSGGPLQYLRASPYCMYNVVGITSFGKFCGLKHSPGVYTRIYKYMDWIEGTVWPSN